MKALVIIAHGSRRAESNQEIAVMTDKVRQLANIDYDVIEHAFLELASPELPEVIDTLVDRGVIEFVILPYFLNSGNHVKKDIPVLLNSARVAHPRCDFKLAKPIGMYAGMPGLILESASQA